MSRRPLAIALAVALLAAPAGRARAQDAETRAFVACLSVPCEVAALIAALGYAGAMIVLGIIR